MRPQIESQLKYYQNNVSDYEKKGLFQRGLDRAFYRKAAIIGSSLSGEGLSVLEVGAGSGLLTYCLVEKFKYQRLVAMDISDEMLKTAKARVGAGAEFVVADAMSLPMEDNSFDAIVGADIVHHLDDPVKALSEWRRVLKPGGQLRILESNAYNPLNLRNIGVEHEVRNFLNTDTNLSRWLVAAGWHGVSVTPAPSFTPAGPKIMAPLLNMIDRLSLYVPFWRRIASHWLLCARK